jgi:hypothetical protein
MAAFIAYPWLAFAVALPFLALWLWRHTRSAAAVCVLWAGYGVYEYLMRARILCSGECNIRVDLLLIYPLLLCASLVAIWRAVRRRSATS